MLSPGAARIAPSPRTVNPAPRDAAPTPRINADLPASPAPGVVREDLARTPSIGTTLTGDTLGGVRMTPPRNVSNGDIINTNSNNNVFNYNTNTSFGGNSTFVDNSTVNYITNVTQANTSWATPGWSPVWGPGACWQGWNCSSGFNFGVGFGGGFSFGLFFGSCNQPFVSNWCNPWWNGWSSFVSVGCSPSWGWGWGWRSSCWSSWGNCWWSGFACAPAFPAFSAPVFAYTPVWVLPSTTTFVTAAEPMMTTVIYETPFIEPAPAISVPMYAPAPLTVAEVQAWDLLSNGFPRSAAAGFAELHEAQPDSLRPMVGYAIALAMLEEFPAAAGVLRDATATNSDVLIDLPLGPTLNERLRLLERSAETAARQAGAARDSLFLLASVRAMLGNYAEAHLAVIAAQQQGDTSAGAAVLRRWLAARLGSSA